MPCHTECKYQGWYGPDEWCRHPDHVEPLNPGRRCAIKAAGGKCASHVPWDARVMPGAEPPWPMPVKMQQITAVFAVCIGMAYKNAEKSAKNDSRAA